jgi:hypothetical protein
MTIKYYSKLYEIRMPESQGKSKAYYCWENARRRQALIYILRCFHGNRLFVSFGPFGFIL